MLGAFYNRLMAKYRQPKGQNLYVASKTSGTIIASTTNISPNNIYFATTSIANITTTNTIPTGATMIKGGGGGGRGKTPHLPNTGIMPDLCILRLTLIGKHTRIEVNVKTQCVAIVWRVSVCTCECVKHERAIVSRDKKMMLDASDCFSC